MDDDAGRLPGPGERAVLLTALGVALLAVAASTLAPVGRGWAWGPPLEELRWYATGLASEATAVQLLGNLGLLAVPAALAVLLRPRLGVLHRLVGAAVATGVGIELLQWALPLGRVVSPLDAALNAVGAVVAGLLVTRLRSWTTSTRVPGTVAPTVRRPASPPDRGGLRSGAAPSTRSCRRRPGPRRR